MKRALYWLSFYYTFVFFLVGYFVSILFFTFFLVYFNRIKKGTINDFSLKGYKVSFDKKIISIWEIPEYYISILLSTSLSFILILLLIKYFLKKNSLVYLRFIIKNNFIWYLITFGVLLITLIVTSFTNSNNNLINWTLEMKNNWFIVLLAAGVFAPVFEETLIRGYFLSRMDELMRHKKEWITIVVSALLFSILHFQYTYFNLVVIFFVGCFLGFLKFRTNTIWFGIIFHIMNNSIIIIYSLWF